MRCQKVGKQHHTGESTRRSRSPLGASVLIVLLSASSLFLFSACQKETPAPVLIQKTVPPFLKIPATVQRLAVLHPDSSDPNILRAYAQLYGAVFQFKQYRPALRIVERLDLDRIVTEQYLQMKGQVSDETMISVGRLLGADAVLLYFIEEPTFHELALARFEGQVPPFVISSKIVQVENGEVLYLNVVTAPVEKWDTDISFFSVSPNLQQALDRGIWQTITDLEQAFQKETASTG